METQFLKRAVLREELFAITRDHIAALILNQFLYWQSRARQFDVYIQEELDRLQNSDNPEDKDKTIALTGGWVYKTAEKLKAEIMVSSSLPTIRRRIKSLVDSGIIDRRTNPNYKWDKTYQYRVNLKKLNEALKKKGYDIHTVFDGKCKMNDSLFDLFESQTDSSKVQKNKNQKEKDNGSSEQKVAAIPEITSKVTKENNIEKQTPLQQITDTYYVLFQEETGKKPEITGAIISQMKRLIKSHGHIPLIELLTKYYHYDYWFTKDGGRTFMNFVAKIDSIKATKGTLREKYKTKKSFKDKYNQYLNE